MRNSADILVILLVTGLTMAACKDSQLKSDLLKFQNQENIEDKNIKTVKGFYKYLDNQDTVSLNGLIDKDFVSYFGSSEESISFDKLKPLIKSFYSAFPDYKHEVENIFASGEFVASKLNYTGTHSNTFMDIKSTGKKISYKGIFIFKIKDGLINEIHGIEDDLTMLTQIGLELK